MAAKNLGSRVRSQRRSQAITQVELARRLGISASYLNLIEHNQRPLTAELLIKLARELNLDLDDFATEREDRLASDLMEVFSDPMFDEHGLNSAEVRELAGHSPAAAVAIVKLYRGFKQSRDSAAELAGRVYADQEVAEAAQTLPNEHINDFIQQRMNHFAEIEEAAEAFVADAGLNVGGRFSSMVDWLREQGIDVVLGGVGDHTVRRYDLARKRVFLADTLPPHSLNFQLATQIAFIRYGDVIDRMTEAVEFADSTARALARVVLANYFAGAVLMPYSEFLAAAKRERYDIEILGHRFGVGFEQVCHRLTTLRRRGAEGVPFHMIRVDLAGNISKRFSASGIRFARFSGACPRWNVFSAFQTPGRVRVQVSEMPTGEVYFCVARTVPKGRGGYHAPHTVQAVGLGCRIEYAKELVYSDGIALDGREGVVPVGVTCRLCEREACEQRVLPSLHSKLVVDENLRTTSFFGTAKAE